jgi:uncharacterized membrane protein
MKPTRLEAFSDGVIAIIITIMVLEIKVPHSADPLALLARLPVFASYAMSFVIIAIYWVNHHHLIHQLTRVDRAVLWSNMNLLFWISLMPWATGYLGENHAPPLAVAIYATIASASSASFLLLRWTIARHHLGDRQLMAEHAAKSRKNWLAIACYAAAIPLGWAAVPLALVLIMFPALMYFLPGRSKAQHEST